MDEKMYCEACGMTFARAAILALLIDLGARTADPNYCHRSGNNEHRWVTRGEAIEEEE